MSARSLNKVLLIGNLTRDPELRYTPNGTAVCTFGLATNRGWTTQTGEAKEETEFHRIVAWNKLGELCSQLLVKGRKVYVEGRLTTRTWTGQDGVQRTTVEVVIEDMIILDSKKTTEGVAGTSFGRDVSAGTSPQGSTGAVVPAAPAADTPEKPAPAKSDLAPAKKPAKQPSQPKSQPEAQAPIPGGEEISADDIPF